MTFAPETASVTPTDSILARWRYLPKLIGILWKLAPWEMAFVGAGSLVSGLVPIGAVLVLRGLVDSVADLISGEGDLSSALVWVGALLAVSLLENALYEAQDWLARGVRDRMVVRIEERLLRKASALSLSAFERPDLYDQMHRARQASTHGSIQVFTPCSGFRRSSSRGLPCLHTWPQRTSPFLWS